MKLLLLTLLGLVAMATGHENKGAEFLVIDEDSDVNDLDHDQVLKDESEAAAHVKALLREDSAGLLKKSSFEDQPPGYDVEARGGDAMFSSNSARNTNTNLTVADASGLLSRSVRQIFGTPTRLYYCPHVNYLLRWFPVYTGSSLTNICFVPWAERQAITYAKCTRPDCSLTNQRTGRCRPSCYTRRRILVFCFHVRTQRWSWRWMVRNLPQACRCSTC